MAVLKATMKPCPPWIAAEAPEGPTSQLMLILVSSTLATVSPAV